MRICSLSLGGRVQALLRLAGVQATPGGAQNLVVDSAKWAAFRDWFVKGLRTLKQVRSSCMALTSKLLNYFASSSCVALSVTGIA